MKSLLAALLIVVSGTAPVTTEEESIRASVGNEVSENMVIIPAGRFQRGCDLLGPEHGAPAHPVYLDAFMIDIYEVTNERLEKVMPDHRLRRSMSSHCDNCPVTKITWYEAADYCHLIGKSLPSEAQWEKASGASNGCEFPWGPDFDPQKKQAHGGLQLKDKASPVGRYPPNKFGVYDMGGNVWEWVTDWYSPEYYFLEPLYNPRGPSRGVMKVRRGGAWSDSIKAMKAGYRDWSYPFSRSYSDIGFRCAINLKRK
jgi:formylglycine-generating enzyme required for sulfatase activity